MFDKIFNIFKKKDIKKSFVVKKWMEDQRKKDKLTTASDEADKILNKFFRK